MGSNLDRERLDWIWDWQRIDSDSDLELMVTEI